MRLTTWNVNGIRNPFAYQPWNSARTYPAMFDILESDIVVMQELKIQRKDLRDDMVILDGWDCYFSLPKHKKGYSGVGIYTRNATCAPIRAEEGLLGVLPSPSGVPFRDLPAQQHIGGYLSDDQIEGLNVDPVMLDAEGRCVALEFPAFILFGVYAPANSNGQRDDFRHAFHCALDRRIRNLVASGKAVILVGDLNVSRDEKDGASAAEDCRKEGISHEQYISTPNRRIFNQLLIGGEVFGERDKGRETGVLWDTSRGFHPDRRGMYTHWEQKINARPGNYGSRIDFILVSESLQSWIKDANIQEGLLGSDHCPVYIDFHDTVGEQQLLVDLMNPTGVFLKGERLQEWRIQDVPQFSGRRLPEFDKRRSIKSMFAAPLTKSASVTEEPSDNDVAEQIQQPSIPILQPSPALTSSPALKRKSSTTAKISPPKRTKSDPAVAGKGQKSLMGFFQPKLQAKKTDTSESNPQDDHGFPDDDVPASAGTATIDVKPELTPASSPAQVRKNDPGSANGSFTEPYSPASTSDSPTKTMQSFEAREQTHRNWNALFSRPVAPLCEHGEPCKKHVDQKKEGL
ncbi:hypothetical protein AMS68_004813 [Peltaster fructicola]|uniref:Endonuclease/exonuclease/phosphatase domain-containing protein n=1 Tax=Peltaster fructicola TaxID=286661 RepID=A0A6H0XX88_9PEZI|nr:hypothetical protein AMS68_004813 [Peltaster fructicola]